MRLLPIPIRFLAGNMVFKDIKCEEVIKMSSAKEQIRQVLEGQPDDSSYDELLRELAFKRMVDKGLADVKQGNVMSNKEMHSRIQSWRK